MVLKKQTVWLLTMLSLIIVLSVYYITSPGGSPADMAYLDEENKAEDQNQTADQGQTNDNEEQASENQNQVNDNGEEQALSGENQEGTEAGQEDLGAEANVSNTPSDEMFAALRIDITEAREKQLEHYQEIVASEDVSAEMKSEAFAKMEELNEQSKQIQVLESLLKNQFGYEDVIVHPVNESNYNIIVKADSLSNQEANEIMRKTAETLGNGNVTVEFAKR